MGYNEDKAYETAKKIGKGIQTAHAKWEKDKEYYEKKKAEANKKK